MNITESITAKLYKFFKTWWSRTEIFNKDGTTTKMKLWPGGLGTKSNSTKQKHAPTGVFAVTAAAQHMPVGVPEKNLRPGAAQF